MITFFAIFFIFLVFVVCCHGDIFRQLVLMARTMGMEVGEYSFIFYTSQPGNPTIGDYSWERGDGYDLVRSCYIEDLP